MSTLLENTSSNSLFSVNRVKREKKLFVSEDGTVSYGDIISLSEQPEIKATRGTLVITLVDNSIDSLSGYLALYIANSVQLMQTPEISKSSFHTLINSYSPSYIWLPQARTNELGSGEVVAIYRSFCLVRLKSASYFVNPSLALLMTTSGSTGSPKFVRLSQMNVLSNAKSIASYLKLNSDEIPITTLPPSYTYGLSIIHSHILVGATIALTKRTFFDRAFWNFLREIKATSFGGVPYHYEILKKLRFSKMELPSLRTLTQAGGRLEPELSSEFATYCHKRGMRFFTMYGQAEATARMSYLPSNKAISKTGSIGIAIPDGQFWLEDENGQVICQPQVPGELIYKGPNVSMGYAYGYEDLAKDDEWCSILRTGDIAKRDEDGDYYIVGRLKRFIKLFGHRINLLDVEKHLVNAGCSAACAGQDGRLEIYVTNISQSEATEIKRAVIDFLKIGPLGVAVIGIQTLPRNTAGKIQYAELTPKMGELLA
jgi:long-chain acyl-CoA synthetase